MPYPIISLFLVTSDLYHSFRLPIIQGGTFAFLAPAFALLSQDHLACPAGFDAANRKWDVSLNLTYEDKTEEWQKRMRELQGAIAVSSIIQLLLGLTGSRLRLA